MFISYYDDCSGISFDDCHICRISAECEHGMERGFATVHNARYSVDSYQIFASRSVVFATVLYNWHT